MSHFHARARAQRLIDIRAFLCTRQRTIVMKRFSSKRRKEGKELITGSTSRFDYIVASKHIFASRKLGKHALSNQIRSPGKARSRHARTATYALTMCLATLFAKSQQDFGEHKRGQIGKARSDLSYLHRCTHSRGRMHVHVQRRRRSTSLRVFEQNFCQRSDYVPLCFIEFP